MQLFQARRGSTGLASALNCGTIPRPGIRCRGDHPSFSHSSDPAGSALVNGSTVASVGFPWTVSLATLNLTVKNAATACARQLQDSSRQSSTPHIGLRLVRMPHRMERNDRHIGRLAVDGSNNSRPSRIRWLMDESNRRPWAGFHAAQAEETRAFPKATSDATAGFIMADGGGAG